MFVFFLREKTGTLSGHVPNNVQESTPQQTIYYFWEDNDIENSQEDTGKGDHVSNCRPKFARQKMMPTLSL